MLDQPPSDKMMRSAPAGKQFHFAATADYMAEIVWADTIEDAEAAYHLMKRLIAPEASSHSTPGLKEEPAEQSTPADEPEAAGEAVQ